MQRKFYSLSVDRSRPTCSMIGYWHDLSVCLWRCALRQNDIPYSKIGWKTE